MVKNSAVDAQVGEAWGQLREGKVNEAINAYARILQTVPNHVDAHYGMGLAQRAAGREADAVESFQRALEVSKEMLAALRSQSGAENQNNLQMSEDDRYMMLIRMIGQRLAELGVEAQ